jgi:hypothetical protein
MNQIPVSSQQGTAGPPITFRQRDVSLKPSARKFTNLDGDDFRHPLDQQNTGLLRSLPGLEAVAKAILGGPGFEQALYLENIGAAVKVGENQLPTIHRLLVEACEILNMDIPGLYVRQVHIAEFFGMLMSLLHIYFIKSHLSWID